MLRESIRRKEGSLCLIVWVTISYGELPAFTLGLRCGWCRGSEDSLPDRPEVEKRTGHLFTGLSTYKAAMVWTRNISQCVWALGPKGMQLLGGGAYQRKQVMRGGLGECLALPTSILFSMFSCVDGWTNVIKMGWERHNWVQYHNKQSKGSLKWQ